MNTSPYIPWHILIGSSLPMNVRQCQRPTMGVWYFSIIFDINSIVPNDILTFYIFASS